MKNIHWLFLDLLASDVFAEYARQHSPVFAQIEGRMTFVEDENNESDLTCGASGFTMLWTPYICIAFVLTVLSESRCVLVI